jgi:hypothetical protein
LRWQNSRNSKSISHPTRRDVPSINNPCISEIKQYFDNEIEPLLFSCVLTNLERDLYPFALVISLRDYRSGRFIGSQLVLLVHWFQVVLVGSLRVWLGESSIQVAG